MHRLQVFGGLRLEGGGGNGVGHATQRRPLALLAALAVSGGQGMSRDRAAGLLWGDTDDKHALRSLSNALYALRSEIGPDAIISTVTDLRINDAVVASDVAEFQAALARGDPAAATAGYAGPLLQGFHIPGAHAFEEWLDLERQRFAGLFAAALERLAREAAGIGDLAGAAVHWRRLAAEDPYNSRVAIELARALAHGGDSGNALQALQAHAQALRVELDAEPGAEVLERIEQLRSGIQYTPVQRKRRATDREQQAGGAASAPAIAPPPAPMAPAAAPADTAPPRTGPPRAAMAVSIGVLLLAVIGWGGSRLAHRWWGPSVRSLAVLPLRNLTGDSAAAPYVDGVTEEITARLGRVAQLRVTSRTSAQLYRDTRLTAAGIAGELGVDGILEGAVVRWGDRVRVTVQVIDARTDRHLGAETVERPWDSLAAVPGQLAAAVIASLGVEPSAEERHRVMVPSPHDPRVTGLLAQGRWPEALALDTMDARAWAAKALAYADSVWMWPVALTWRAAPYLRTAREAADRAVRLDSTEDEAWHALGLVRTHAREYPAAEEALRRAVTLAPSNGEAHGDLAWLLLLRGRTDASIAESRLGVTLDPRSKAAYRNYLWILMTARRWDAYEPVAREWLRIWPDQAGRSDLYGNSLMAARTCEGRLAEGLAVLDSTLTWLGDAAYPHADPMRAIILARMGRRAEAVATVRAAERITDAYVRRFWMAMAYAGIGEMDNAVAAFRDAAAMNESGLDALIVTCLGDPFRADPHWPELAALISQPH